MSAVDRLQFYFWVFIKTIAAFGLDAHYRNILFLLFPIRNIALAVLLVEE